MTASVKRLASLGFWLPTLSSTRSSGTARWLIWSVPTGWSTNSASAGSSVRSDTSTLLPLGSTARQLLRLPSSPPTIGITATGGSTVSRSSPQVKSIGIEIEKKKNEILPLPCACQGVGPSIVRSTSMP